jgi:hypothetical protein
MPRFANNTLWSENMGTDRMRPKFVFIVPSWTYLSFKIVQTSVSRVLGRAKWLRGEENNTVPFRKSGLSEGGGAID